MANKLIHLRVPTNLYKKAAEISKEGGYRNVQDVALESLRKTAMEYCRQRALKTLEAEFGKYKGKIKRLTREEREKIFEEFAADKNRSDIFGKYGLYKV